MHTRSEDQLTSVQLRILVGAVQELSLARDLETIMRVVRKAARDLTGADGATFVLKDTDLCYYAEEDAIAPLWKGQRFPMSTCISGWTMINKQAAVIEDIYKDPRIPHEAYRPTFVKSLAMVPIRTLNPIGAIGNYWATKRQPTAVEVNLLSSLADITSVSIENVYAYNDLTTQNNKLYEIAFMQAHQVRAPVAQIQGLFNLFRFDEPSHPMNIEVLKKLKTVSETMDSVIKEILEKTSKIRPTIN
jgi:GAF domain-containing protein